jgi:cytochrome P450 family 135
MTTVAPSLPPGPRMPRALQLLGWRTRPGPLLERCRERYGDAFTLHPIPGETAVVLSDPEAVKQVFTGDPRLLHAGEANKVLLPLLGRSSVLLLDEGAHIAQRKLMLPAFHGERMARYEELMASATERELERWPAREPVSLIGGMQAITLEVIVEAVFGVRGEERQAEMRDRLRETLEKTGDPRSVVALLTLGPERMYRSRFFQRELEPVNEIVLEEIRRRRSESDLDQRDDILSMLLGARHEDGSAMSDSELRDELMTLLVAGHETTATALAWAVERLVRHPEMMRRLAEECAAGEDAYADAVAKETLRLRPVIPMVVRKLKEPMEIGGRLLPAGVAAAPSIYLMHRRADIYPEPARFRPERFLEQPAGTYTWIPFGGGVRRCLGATFALFEMRVVLSTLVTRLRLRAAEPSSERAVRRTPITLAPSRGAEVVVEPLDGARAAVPA